MESQGKRFYANVVRDKETPLSALLFVSTAEILQYAINDAWQRGIISLPSDNDFGKKFPII
jgi:hypothetical protein